MKIFEEEDPFDPVEDPEPSPLPSAPGRPEPAPARGRSAGILLLFVIDLALAGASAGGLLLIAGARAYLVKDSSDFGSEMSDALVGLQALTVAGLVLTAGFLLSALGVLSLTRIGYRLQVLWAILVCFTLVGIPYAVAVLVFLRRPSTHERFFA